MDKKLNPWWRVLGRRTTRWFRRRFFAWDTPIRRRLYAERREVANPYPDRRLTETERARLSDINWWLGFNSVYESTPKQRQRQLLLAARIVERLRAEEKGG
jgi:hypothetical protein